MINYAGRDDVDKEVADELLLVGIHVEKLEILRNQGEVKTSVRGDLHGWSFFRAWYYWIAGGPGIPPSYANKLHEEYGQEVRVRGNCTCPSPLEAYKGFAVGIYHVDTQIGLKALADTIRQVVEEAKEEVK